MTHWDWILPAAAAVGMLVTAGGIVLHLGRTEGRITTVLEQLTTIAKDHEDRIRAQELRCNGIPPQRRHRGF